MDQLTDEELMTCVQNGRLDFMEGLFDRYQKKIFNYFLKCTGDSDESQDLVQSVFIRVMKYRRSFKEHQIFKIWLFQIARNLVKDHFRKMKIYRDQFSSLENLPDQSDMALDEVKMERERKLFLALERLSPDRRELLILSKFQGMKYEEVAEIRGTSVSAVKVQVHRTIKKLREIIFEELTE